MLYYIGLHGWLGNQTYQHMMSSYLNWKPWSMWPWFSSVDGQDAVCSSNPLVNCEQRVSGSLCATICRALKAWEWLAAAPRVQVEERQVKTKKLKQLRKLAKERKNTSQQIEKESERGDSQKRTCNWRAEGTLRRDAKEETDQLNPVV